jgi:hypothetical protein
MVLERLSALESTRVRQRVAAMYSSQSLHTKQKYSDELREVSMQGNRRGFLVGSTNEKSKS